MPSAGPAGRGSWLPRRRVRDGHPRNHFRASASMRRAAHDRRRSHRGRPPAPRGALRLHPLRGAHLSHPGLGEGPRDAGRGHPPRGHRGVRRRRDRSADRRPRRGGGDRRARGHQHHHRPQERPDGPVAPGAPRGRHRHAPAGPGGAPGHRPDGPRATPRQEGRPGRPGARPPRRRGGRVPTCAPRASPGRCSSSVRSTSSTPRRSCGSGTARRPAGVPAASRNGPASGTSGGTWIGCSPAPGGAGRLGGPAGPARRRLRSPTPPAWRARRRSSAGPRDRSSWSAARRS